MGLFDSFDRWLRKFGLFDNDDDRELEQPTDEKTKTIDTETKGTLTPTKQENDIHTASNVLDFNSASSNRETNSPRLSKYTQSEIKIFHPKEFDEVRTISNLLRNQNVVLVNFEKIDVKEATRMISFISGTVYAVEGRICKVSDKVFVCVPNNVKLSYSEDDKKPISLDY